MYSVPEPDVIDPKNVVLEDRIYNIPVDDIYVDDSFNSRGQITGIECQDLKASMEERGQQMPGAVRISNLEDLTIHKKPFSLVWGFRRYYAVKNLLLWPTYRAVVKPIMSTEEAKALNYSENENRQNLNILQKARHFQWYYERGFTEAEILSYHQGLTRGQLQPLMMLLRLGPEIQKIAAEGHLSPRNIRDITSIVGDEDQLKAAKAVKAAKESGKKIAKVHIPIGKEKQDRASLKRKRSPKEISDFLMILHKQNIPFGFFSRCLSWAAGRITDQDLIPEIQEFADNPANNPDLQDYLLTIDAETSIEEIGKKIKYFCTEGPRPVFTPADHGQLRIE